MGKKFDRVRRGWSLKTWVEDALDDARVAVGAGRGARNLRRWARGWTGGVALVVLCLTVYVPGLVRTWPIDRDEPRFAQASRQMLEAARAGDEGGGGENAEARHAGGWLVPMVGEVPRDKKPPLIYWLQALAVSVTGGDPVVERSVDAAVEGRQVTIGPIVNPMWRYRLPSVLGAMAMVLITWRVGVSMFDARAAWLGAALLAVSPLVVWDAHLARSDQVLCAVTTGAMGCLWMIWRRGRAGRRGARGIGAWGWPLGLWALVGLGILTKGPITPMVVGLTAVSLCVATRRWRWVMLTKPIVGVVVAAAVSAWWFVAVWQWRGSHAELSGAASAGWPELNWFDESVGRLFRAHEGHWAPPGYHVVMLVLLFWPGSLLTALAVRRALGRAFRDRPPAALTVEGDATVDADRQPRNVFERVGRWVMNARSAWHQRTAGRGAELFCLCWAVPSWVVFELSVTKLPHYTLPLYPALALLSGRAVFAGASGLLAGLGERATAWGVRAWFAVGLVWCGVFVVGSFLFGRGLLVWPMVGPLVAVGVVYVATRLLREAWWRVDKGQWVEVQLLGVVAGALLMACSWELFVPGLSRQLSPEAARRIAELEAEGRGPFALVGYQEDSLVWLTSARATKLESRAEAVEAWATANPSGVIIARIDGELFDLVQRDKGSSFELGKRIGPGYNYSKGRVETLIAVDPREWLAWRRNVGNLLGP